MRWRPPPEVRTLHIGEGRVKALVTGGTGFIGRRLSQSLLQSGHDVRVLARGRSHGPVPGAELVCGDIQDRALVARAVAGADVVFHTAAKVGIAGTRAEFEAVNVGGTQNLLDACREAGVPRFVFTSTPSVVIGDEDLEGADETLPYLDRYRAYYPETKAEAERRVRAAHGDGLATTSLRPHIVYGPEDTSLLPRILARAHRLRRIGPGGKRTDVVYIDDAVQAHLLADEALRLRPEVVGGRVYFVTSGEPIEIWTFVDRLLGAAGRPPLRKTMPLGVALGLARVVEGTHRLLGVRGEPPLSRWVVHELTTSHWFDIGAVRRDLGFEPRVGLDEGLSRLARWLEHHAPRAP